MALNIKNTYYEKLTSAFYTRQEASKVKKPELIIFNKNLSNDLEFEITDVSFISETLSGNRILENSMPIAQAYAGHQFGYFNMLGDGRAILLGEIEKNGKLYDLQLKGSGKTPYSRRGDGKAALAPMIREYIISEAMHFLGIPTTRSLAVIKTGEFVYRETKKIGAILARIASSHIRVGTFEYALNFLSEADLKSLADYTIDRHFPNLTLETKSNYKYFNFLNKVIELQASLIAKWNLVGFIHGVMNTDNILVSGETIDYGPCAFMDSYDPDTVFSSIDTYGRYRYKNQPHIAVWNLTVFAETLLPLFNYTYDEKDKNSLDEKKAIELIEKSLLNFNKIYEKFWLDGMRNKLGLFEKKLEDKVLIDNLLKIMHKYKADYTNTFVGLTLDSFISSDENSMLFYNSPEFEEWKNKWKLRVAMENKAPAEHKKLMMSNNPFVIPRNYIVEEVLSNCEKGDSKDLNKFLKILEEPYNYKIKIESKYLSGTLSKVPYKTYCGT